jgi:type IV pilus assembly protein PilE
MKTLQRKRILGFTIIELMIVVMIVAILLAIAYPSYARYVLKANRGDAQQLLMNWSINQEIWRSNHTTYAADDLDTGIPAPEHDKFDFSIADESATTYTLQAEATGGQADDKTRDGSTYCGKSGSLLTLSQNGVKAPAGCWE